MFRDITVYLYLQAAQTYNFLTDGEVSYGAHYSILRHSRPFIIYQGVKTQIPVTVFGDNPLPEDRRVFLQRRGYRTGLFGWTIGGLLGGSKLPGIEVTPEREVPMPLPSLRQRDQLDDDIRRLFSPSEPELKRQKPLQTLVVHIPVASGDGYFRLRVTTKNPSKTIGVSPVFRVGSLSWVSAHPQGATIFGLIPELLVKTVFVAAKTTAYASFYASFPLLKLAEYTPGPWRQYAMRTLYTHSFSPEQQNHISENIAKGREGLRKANDSIYKKVPFGAAGVRTYADLEKDESMGRGGFWTPRK